jgi:hypothetical protein
MHPRYSFSIPSLTEKTSDRKHLCTEKKTGRIHCDARSLVKQQFALENHEQES